MAGGTTSRARYGRLRLGSSGAIHQVTKGMYGNSREPWTCSSCDDAQAGFAARMGVTTTGTDLHQDASEGTNIDYPPLGFFVRHTQRLASTTNCGSVWRAVSGISHRPCYDV